MEIHSKIIHQLDQFSVRFFIRNVTDDGEIRIGRSIPLVAKNQKSGTLYHFRDPDGSDDNVFVKTQNGTIRDAEDMDLLRMNK